MIVLTGAGLQALGQIAIVFLVQHCERTDERAGVGSRIARRDSRASL